MGPMGPQGPQEGTGGTPRGTGTSPEARGHPQRHGGHFRKNRLFAPQPPHPSIRPVSFPGFRPRGGSDDPRDPSSHDRLKKLTLLLRKSWKVAGKQKSSSQKEIFNPVVWPTESRHVFGDFGNLGLVRGLRRIHHSGKPRLPPRANCSPTDVAFATAANTTFQRQRHVLGML